MYWPSSKGYRDLSVCICIKYVDGSTSGLYFDGVECAMRLSKNVGEQF
jgi:hypothetical protein